MKQVKQILVWLLIVLVVAVIAYYILSFVMPAASEGFSATAYPTSVSVMDGKSAITNLYFIKNRTSLLDASLNAVMVDVSNVCPASATEMSKECFSALLDKFSLKTDLITAPENVSASAAQNIVSVLNKQLGLGYSTLSTEDIQTAMMTQTDLSGICKVSHFGAITKDCYNALLNAFVFNANKNGVICSATEETEQVEGEDIDKIKGTIPKKMPTDSSILDKLISLSKSDSDPSKCTVEFGKDTVNPQEKAATPKAPATTCTTTGDVANTTKTPAVDQGCDFAKKFPKVNVINLRDYVHKDEIPCWSCKL
jgi:hypothetical protein